MKRLIKKSEQFNDLIFGGQFFVNKPVYPNKESVHPYSSVVYWSNGYIKGDSLFDLHPHQGFEIMTFIFEGKVEHFDTATQVWTPLHGGDFQIIQSNSGIQHSEKVLKGTRSFQIWFDPHFYETVKLKPSYKDYYGKDLSTVIENGIETLIYVGEGSGTKVTTPNLTIKKLIFKERTKTTYPLKKSMSYTFYALYGEGFINGEKLDTDDAIRISDTDELEIDFKGEVFFVETPTELDYEPIWSYKQS
jgi:redox-sensitive bicupin YhaK (pirin superfamily)